PEPDVVLAGAGVEPEFGDAVGGHAAASVPWVTNNPRAGWLPRLASEGAPEVASRQEGGSMPGRILTSNLRLPRPTLYPVELRARVCEKLQKSSRFVSVSEPRACGEGFQDFSRFRPLFNRFGDKSETSRRQTPGSSGPVHPPADGLAARVPLV